MQVQVGAEHANVTVIRKRRKEGKERKEKEEKKKEGRGKDRRIKERLKEGTAMCSLNHLLVSWKDERNDDTIRFRAQPLF